jgi:hypothetical protein
MINMRKIKKIKACVWVTAMVLVFSPIPGMASILDEITYSPDITAVFGGVTANDEDAVVDDLAGTINLMDLGSIPNATDLNAYHLLDNGDQLVSFDTTVILDGLVTEPGDVVRIHFDGLTFTYTLEFDASAEGLPSGVITDAVSTENSSLLLSFDTTVNLNGDTVDDEDLVSFDGASFSPFFDGSSVGVSSSLDLDGAHYENDRLLLSLDGSGVIDGVFFDDEDVLEYDTVTSSWTLDYDGSVEHDSWSAADLNALHASLSAACDIDEDRDIDRGDVRTILMNRNQPSSGPDDPMDADGDEQITVRDAKICISHCTNPRCAPQ